MCNLLDTFLSHPDARERHEIIVDAPAALVLKTALNFDIQSIPSVRAIFWLRAKILGARTSGNRAPIGLIEELLGLGWGKLGEEPERYFCAGAICQPWQADVAFKAVGRGEFAAFAEPGWVKIAWIIEVEALEPAVTRLATETRAVATDPESRAKFKRYWLVFSIGIRMIRRLLLRAVQRQASRQKR